MQNLEIKNQGNEAKQFLQRIGVLNSGVCPRCLAYKGNGVVKDGLYKEIQIFYCNFCRTKFRETTGSWFFRCIFKLQMFFTILNYFVEGMTVKQNAALIYNNFADEYKMSYNTIHKLYRLFRSLIHAFILKYINQLRFDGEIEIDEAHIYKEKDIRGRPYQFNYWVFGLKGRQTKQSLILPVRNRRHQTLISIILGKYYNILIFIGCSSC